MNVLWNFDEPISFNDEKFLEIFFFFVIETPVGNCSRRGIPLKNYKLNPSVITTYLKKEIPSLNKNWKTVPAKESSQIESVDQDIRQLCKENKILNGVDDCREIFIQTTMKKNKTLSLFYTIRCAFAHGAFNRKEYHGEIFYFLENTYKGKLRGRANSRKGKNSFTYYYNNKRR